jgi:hypothetical protein
MQCSAIRDRRVSVPDPPDFAALHPGYEGFALRCIRDTPATESRSPASPCALHF